MRRLQILLATAMCIFGCALLVAGLALPPAGTIDSSLLVAYGETLTFAGSLIGIDYHYRSFPTLRTRKVASLLVGTNCKSLPDRSGQVPNNFWKSLLK